MGKYIPVQTNRGITGDVLIEISENTVTGLILPEIVYNFKKKLRCIFIKNHNSEPLKLKKGPAKGLVTSFVVRRSVRKIRKASQDRVMTQDTQIGGTS